MLLATATGYPLLFVFGLLELGRGFCGETRKVQKLCIVEYIPLYTNWWLSSYLSSYGGRNQKKIWP